MPKGFFTQGVMILTEHPLAAEAVDRALESFKVAKRSPASGEKNWLSGYPSWIVAMRPEVNGYVVVDVVDAKWPDSMGDPQKEPLLFAGWSMGHMGPHTWPGNLDRAIMFSAATGGKAAAEAASRHTSFVRIRSSYILGADDKAKVMPEDYHAPTELEFVTHLAQAIARAPGALCYFNPGGETLFLPDAMDDIVKRTGDANLFPLPLWSQVRMMRIEDSPPWMIADIVGMEQLEAQDQEACFRRGTDDANEVVMFLRNISQYVLDKGPVIKNGHTSDGPGGIWRAVECTDGLLPAPRSSVLRWYPDDVKIPPALLRGANSAAPQRASGGGGLFSGIKSLFKRR